MKTKGFVITGVSGSCYKVFKYKENRTTNDCVSLSLTSLKTVRPKKELVFMTELCLLQGDWQLSDSCIFFFLKMYM